MRRMERTMVMEVMMAQVGGLEPLGAMEKDVEIEEVVKVKNNGAEKEQRREVGRRIEAVKDGDSIFSIR